MRKLYVIIVFFLLIATQIFAQQEAQVSHNMFNNMAINPGYAGMRDAICATAILRQQWVGFKDVYGNKGAPQTNLISLDAGIKPLRGGLGMTIMQDKLGFEKNISIKLGYAYHLFIGPGRLGIGAQVGFLNKEIDFSQFHPLDSVGDPLLTSKAKESTMITDISFGAYYQIPQKLHFGISTSQLLQSDGNLGTKATLDLKRHYYIVAGYIYPLPMNPTFELLPSVLIKTDISSTQFDINALVKYNNQFWGGVSYRQTDAIVAMLGVSFKDINIGYAYDITTSDIGKEKRSNGSHEIMIGYCFKVEIERIPQSYRNVRFL